MFQLLAAVMAYIAWGVIVALLSVASIWLITPALKILQLVLSAGKQSSDGRFIYTFFLFGGGHDEMGTDQWKPTSIEMQCGICLVNFTLFSIRICLGKSKHCQWNQYLFG